MLNIKTFPDKTRELRRRGKEAAQHWEGLRKDGAWKRDALETLDTQIRDS